jgi:hypothetical protein
MFSFITTNWRRRPLTTLRNIIELISAATTDNGLSIQAVYDPEVVPHRHQDRRRPTRRRALQQHAFHGEWNYTIAQSAAA